MRSIRPVGERRSRRRVWAGVGLAAELLLACAPTGGGSKSVPEPVPAQQAAPQPDPPPPLPDVGAPLTGPREGLNDAAVLVAIEAYNYGLAPIPGARANAEAWRQFLLDVRGVPAARLRFLIDRDATDDSILRAIRSLAPTVSKSGRLWFVFIGHGAPGTSDQGGLLVGVDAQADVAKLVSRSVSQADLVRALSATKGQAIAVLDACFSGRDLRGDWLLKGLQPSVPIPAAPKKKGSSRVLVLAAATNDQYAGQLADHERPAFSYLVLGALRGWADSDGDGSVTAEEVVTYSSGVLAAVLHERRTQTPTLMGPGKTPLASAREADPGLVALLTAYSSAGMPNSATSDAVRDDCSRTHFGPDWPTLELPDERTAAASTSKGGSLQSDIAYAAARRAQSEAVARPHEAELAWCALAAVENPNPHLRYAGDLCRRWRTYNEGIAWFTSDYRCLRAVLAAHEHVGTARVQRHINEFWLRYGRLPWRQEFAELQPSAPNLVIELTVSSSESRAILVDIEAVSRADYERCIQLGTCRGRLDGLRELEPSIGCEDNAVAARDRNEKGIRCISPEQADAYCRWIGKSLPSIDKLKSEQLFRASGPRYEIAREDRGGHVMIDVHGDKLSLSRREGHGLVGFRCSREVRWPKSPVK